MKPRGRGLFSFLADLAIRFSGGRPNLHDVEQRLQRMDYRTDTSDMGVRMTTRLRDRLRRGWLRIRREH